MKYIAVVIITYFFLGPLAGQESMENMLDRYNSRTVPYISVEELYKFQDNGQVLILDVREKNEFDISHIPSARYIGYTDFNLEKEQLPLQDKGQLIVVYCSLGIRSEQIGEKLQQAKFTNVKNLYGGIFEWKNHRFPVVDSTGKHTENIHAFSKKWSKWLHEGNPVYNK